MKVPSCSVGSSDMQKYHFNLSGLKLLRRNAGWQVFRRSAGLLLTWLLLGSAFHGSLRGSVTEFGKWGYFEWMSGIADDTVAPSSLRSTLACADSSVQQPVQKEDLENLQPGKEDASTGEPPLRAIVQNYSLEAAFSQGVLRASAAPRLKAFAVGTPSEAFEKQVYVHPSLNPSPQHLGESGLSSLPTALAASSPSSIPIGSAIYPEHASSPSWIQIEDLLLDKRRLRAIVRRGGEADLQLRVASASGSQVRVSVRLLTDWSVTAAEVRRQMFATTHTSPPPKTFPLDAASESTTSPPSSTSQPSGKMGNMKKTTNATTSAAPSLVSSRPQTVHPTPPSQLSSWQPSLQRRKRETPSASPRRAPPLGTLLSRLASRKDNEALFLRSSNAIAQDSEETRRMQRDPLPTSEGGWLRAEDAFLRRTAEALSAESLATSALAAASVQQKVDAVLTAELAANVGSEAFVNDLRVNAAVTASSASSTSFRIARQVAETPPASSSPASEETSPKKPRLRVFVWDEKAFASLQGIYPLRVLVGWRCSPQEVRQLRRRANKTSAPTDLRLKSDTAASRPRPVSPVSLGASLGTSLSAGFFAHEWLDPALFLSENFIAFRPPPFKLLAMKLLRSKLTTAAQTRRPQSNPLRREAEDRKNATFSSSPPSEERRRLALLRQVEASLRDAHVKVESVQRLYRQPGLEETGTSWGAENMSRFRSEKDREEDREEMSFEENVGAPRRVQRVEKAECESAAPSCESERERNAQSPDSLQASLLTSPELCGVDLIRLAVSNVEASAETDTDTASETRGTSFRYMESFIRGLAESAPDNELLFVTPDAKIKVESVESASKKEEGLQRGLCAVSINDPLVSLQWSLGCCCLDTSESVCESEGKAALFGFNWRGSDHQLKSQSEKLAALCKRSTAFNSPSLLPSEKDASLSMSSRKDIRFSEAWHFRRVLERDAFQATLSSVPVAVIDTGLDFLHPDLAGGLWLNRAEVEGIPGVDDDGNGFVDDAIGWNFLHNNNNPTDDHGHGTHVAGIIAARCNNGIGICGISDQARVMALKILDRNGEGDVSNAIPAIRYAVSNGAAVVTNSWGGVSGGAAYVLGLLLEQAVSDASGSVFVIASGNDGRNISAAPYYPASFLKDWTATVGAHDRYGDCPSWSNFGEDSLLLTAPGELVLSTWTGGGYRLSSGTSMAAPMVSGVAVQLVALTRGLALPQQVVDVLARSAEREALHIKPSRRVSLTGGRLNAEKALTLGASLFAFPRTAILHLGTEESLSFQTLNIALRGGLLPQGEYRAALQLVYARLAAVSGKEEESKQTRVLQLVKVIVPVEMVVVM